MVNNNPDTLAVFTALLNLPEITVTSICNEIEDREVTIVVSLAIIGERDLYRNHTAPWYMPYL